MGNGYTTSNTNVYFRARKDAAIYNDKLCSREGAAELLGLSVSSLADYELGITKAVPVDKVVLMADLYKHPELKTRYCKYECPIGKKLPMATESKSIESATLKLLNILDASNVESIKSRLISLATKSEYDCGDEEQLDGLLEELDGLSMAISEIKLCSERIRKGAYDDGCKSDATTLGN